MDRILKELFGGDDEPTATPAATPATSATTETTAKSADVDREARREARQQRRNDPERRRKREEFVERYTTGDPSEGFTTQEAIEHLREMREEMSPAEFRAAMQQTLENLPPSQRDDFIAIMRQYKAGQPTAAPGAGASTPGATTQAAAADPFGGVLTGLMGGSAGGAAGVDLGALLDDLQKGGLRAPSSSPGQQPTEADFRALLESPLGRAVLGGVAAHGMQNLQVREDDDDVDYGTRTRGGF